jgi:hypothetical protein
MTQRPEDDSPGKAQPPQAKKKTPAPQSGQAAQVLLHCRTIQQSRLKRQDRRNEDRPLVTSHGAYRRRIRLPSSPINYGTLRRTWHLERRAHNNVNQISYQVNRQDLPMPEEVQAFLPQLHRNPGNHHHPGPREAPPERRRARLILKGGSRGNPKQLAYHLQRVDTNERVTILELQHPIKDLEEAFYCSQALSEGSPRAKKGLYHLNIDPHERYEMTPEKWQRAVEIAEKTGV